MIKDFSIPIIIFLIGFVMLWGTPLHHDISWYLISTKWWIDGLPIYKDILELNPPLAFYLTVPPVFLAEIFNISPTSAMKGYVLLLIFLSLIWSRRIINKKIAVSSFEKTIFLASATVALVLLPISDFGQREHIFVILFLPYFTLSFVDPDGNIIGKKQRAMIGVWSTFGVALKHYFALVVILIVIGRCLVTRSIRPIFAIENIAMAIILALYLLGTIIIHPEYFESVVPKTLLVYDTYKVRTLIVLLLADTVLILNAVLLGYVVFNKENRVIGTIFILSSLGGFLTYLVQSKGWSYHLIPPLFFVVMGISCLAAKFVKDISHWWPSIPAVLVILYVLVPTIQQGTYENAIYPRVLPYFNCPIKERTFQAFGSNVSLSFPLANVANAEPANRAPTLWLFPGAAYHLEHASTAEERQVYTDLLNEARNLVLDDFFRVRPQLVLVDTRKNKSYFKGVEFDYVAFFSEDERFAEAWEEYELKDSIAEFEIYARANCD